MERIIFYYVSMLLICIMTNTCASESFSSKHLVAMQRIDNPLLSPDESKFIFTVGNADLRSNKINTTLWIMDLQTPRAKPTQLTPARLSIKNPQWVKTSESVFFLGKEKDHTQIWHIDTKRKKPKQLTQLPVNINHFVLSPDQHYIAFSAEVYPDCGADFQCTHLRDLKIEKKQSTGRMYTKLFIRHWDTWKNGKRSHLFAFKLDKKGNPKGAPWAITTTLDADVPPKPFANHHHFAFSADSKHLVFSARIAGYTEPWSTNFDLFITSIEGGNISNLTADNPAWDDLPVLSADGQWLAYLAMKRPGYESDRFYLKLRNLKTGETHALLENWDRSLSSLAFTPDSQHIIINAHDQGQLLLSAIDIKQNTRTPITTEGSVKSFSAGKNTILFSFEHFKMPAELFSSDYSGQHTTQLTHFNKDALQTLRIGDYEDFTFKGWNNEEVHGFIVKPANFSSDQHYPAAFLIHGGPQGNFSNNFHYSWNPQIYAGAGYAAIMINFHGSTGYGQTFTDSINNDWGGKPFIDLQKGLESVLQHYPWVDKERICALGGSYGGYMINWIAGNWPGRFKCLVNHAGIMDTRMMYYTTEELWFEEWEYGSPQYTNPAAYEQYNPIHHVNKWQDPMLITQGGLDFRVPETQSFASFTALQRRGIPSRLLYFPDENHRIQKPFNTIQWHEEILNWLNLYLK